MIWRQHDPSGPLSHSQTSTMPATSWASRSGSRSSSAYSSLQRVTLPMSIARDAELGHSELSNYPPRCSEDLMRSSFAHQSGAVDRHHDSVKLAGEPDLTRLTTIAHVSKHPDRWAHAPHHRSGKLQPLLWAGSTAKDSRTPPVADKFHVEHPDTPCASEYGCEGIESGSMNSKAQGFSARNTADHVL